MSPSIHVRCEALRDSLSRVTLSLSDSFSYEIVGADSSFEQALIAWLTQYSQKAPSSPPLSFFGSPFQQKVLSELSKVPFGTTLSYQDLAKKCDCPNGARAIGNACKKNPFPLLIPCHRVIRADGSLGGFALDRKIKQRLLAFEGKES